jgi:hypothetical protein
MGQVAAAVGHLVVGHVAADLLDAGRLEALVAQRLDVVVRERDRGPRLRLRGNEQDRGQDGECE